MCVEEIYSGPRQMSKALRYWIRFGVTLEEVVRIDVQLRAIRKNDRSREIKVIL